MSVVSSSQRESIRLTGKMDIPTVFDNIPIPRVLSCNIVLMLSFLYFRLSRIIFESCAPFLEWLIFKLVFPDGVLYQIGRWHYYKYFDTSLRQLPPEATTSTSTSQEDYQNPLVVGRNRQRAHSQYRSFSSKSKALSFWRERDSKGIIAVAEEDHQDIFYLTGKCGEPTVAWKFQLIGHPDNAPKAWFLKEFDDAAWDSVMLPNHWQLQGHDIPIYTNTVYPFRFNPPFTVRDGHWTNTLCDLGLGMSPDSSAPLHPKEPGTNATGLYRKEFILPEEWSKDQIEYGYYVVFEGVDCNLSVWLNDRFLGYSQDSCLPTEFDITKEVEVTGRAGVSGRYSLSVMVNRWSDGSYLEDQDKWWLSGIYREIYVVRRPRSRILDYEWTATPVVPGDLASFTLNVSVLLDISDQHISLPIKVDAELWDGQSKHIITQTSSEVNTKTQRSEKLENRRSADEIIDTESADHDIPLPRSPLVASFSLPLTKPPLWSAEAPHLHSLLLTLNIGGEEVQTVSNRVGVRTVTIDGPNHTLNVNGKAVVVAGVNRHEFHCETGRAVSRATMVQDVLIMKSLNFNAVRCSHYPSHPFFLEVCDELGLYVIDEANIETHGFQVFGQPLGYLSDLPEWRGAMASRIARMFERDKNATSVIGWSLGNESGFGETHALMAQWLRQRDRTRFVQYESGGARTVATDIICPMYLKPSWCTQQAMTDAQRRPVILCEYAHAMGNSGGALEKYWQIFWDEVNHPRVQGGFIWDFVDQGIARIDGEGKGQQFLYGGDFGDRPNTHHFCCNGLLAADRSLYPSAFTVRNLQLPVAFAVQSEEGGAFLVIENRNRFVSLDDLVFECNLKAQQKNFEAAVLLSSFRIAERDIAPGQLRRVNLRQQILDNAVRATSATNQVEGGVVWFEVVVKKLPHSSLWNSQWCGNEVEVELGHFSFENKQLLNCLPANSYQVIPRVTARPTSSNFSLRIERNDANHLHFLLGSEDVRVVVDKLSGQIIEYSHLPSQRNLLLRPLQCCLFRAPTDNDVGGGDLSYAARWRAVGLDRLVHRLTSFSWKLDYEKQLCAVDCSWVLSPSPTSSSPSDSVEIPVSVKYTLYCDSVVDVVMQVAPPTYLPSLPRCGVNFAIPSDYQQVRWLGLGPHEAYDDRRAGVYLDIFEADVNKDLHTSYICPQENGRRADPR